jgi:hypothetical protein
VTARGLDALYDKYHSDSVCDRDEFNRFKSSVDRKSKIERLTQGDRYKLVPDEETIICPAVVHSLYPSSLASTPLVTGFDRSWVVENTASVPVVLLWVDPRDGVEKSAFHDTVPATADPDAVLPPGSWTVVQAYEGHVFHVREILPDGITMGRVLLQHRLGWIPVGMNLVGNKAGHLVCPDVDEEPLLLPSDLLDEEEVGPVSTKDDWGESLPLLSSSNRAQRRLHLEFERTPFQEDRDCNRQEVGFRNVLDCPLHGYFLEEETCDPVFKFHLGVDAGYPRVADFMDDWNSRTKFEAGLLGHTFVFRSAHTGAEVDRITLLPTTVSDCPGSAVPADPMIVRQPEPVVATHASVLPSGDVYLLDDAPLSDRFGKNSSGTGSTIALISSLHSRGSSSMHVVRTASQAFPR